MSEYRKCVVLLFKRIGMGTPGEDYLDDLEALNRAAGEWHEQPEAKRLGFLEFDMPDLLDGSGVVTGDLPLAIRYGWAKNEAAKAFVRYIDDATGNRATLLMLQMIVLLQQLAQDAKLIASVTRGAG